MEKVRAEEFGRKEDIHPKKENVAFFMRPEKRQIGKIERIQNIENTIKENLDEIELLLREGREEEMPQDKYFETYAKLNDLISITERLGNADLLKRLVSQAKLLEEIKSKRQKAGFKKLESWKSFKNRKK